MGRHSTGCRTCVNRKVRCDETRPHCLRCVRRRQLCPGYADPKSITFVNETDQIYQQHQKSKAKQTTGSQVNSAFELKQTCYLQEQFSLVAFAPTIYQAFLLNRFVATGVEYFDHNTNGEWMKIIFSEPHRYPLGSHALLTLAECFYGRRHHQDKIVRSSMQGYGAIIHRLRQSLTDQIPFLSHDLVAAVASLYFFECFIFTSNEAWLQHADALSTLVQALGRQAFQHPPASEILEAVREPLICAAIVARKKTFLQDEDWRMHVHQHDTFNFHIAELNQIYARIPQLAERILSLQTGAMNTRLDTCAAEDIQHDIMNLCIGLDSWSLTWDKSYNNYISKVSLSALTATNIDCSDIITELFDFQNLKIAKVFINYWTTRILLFFQVRKLRRIFHQQNGYFTDPNLDSEANAFALNICCSIPFFMQPIHIESASFYLSVPIRVAYLALSPSSEEARWLYTVRGKLADFTGVEILRNIIDNVPMRKHR